MPRYLRHRLFHVLVALGSLGLLLVVALAVGLDIRLLPAHVPGARPKSASALEAEWDALLAGTVRDGVVDYAQLAERKDRLDRFIGTLSVFGPRTASRHFEREESAFAYYINAYNALVIFAVLERDVEHSVHEVRGAWEPIAGMGFFWAQRFLLDGETLSLHRLEHGLLRARFSDARLHAAINCASVSCPPLSPSAYRGATLSADLTAAARRFTAPPHVRVDHGTRTIHLSAIYRWYAEDFEADAKRLGHAADTLAWIAHYADNAEPIVLAQRRGYKRIYQPYDWRLNRRR